ncbi:Uncharacterized protein DBV15_11130 [Temnothorax longispinosus]|uniref:Uncharacterized protein n=1 Tax=Temnothorax longispinosus TaxID=300112 RepID=A0A4S2KHK2_9HYME|nr:Uncharacterized protein DBV15_11130 [Temnothorax longispinosus]
MQDRIDRVLAISRFHGSITRGRLAVIWECPVADNRRSSSDVAAGMDGKSRIISGADARRLSRAGTPISLAQGPLCRRPRRAGVKGVVTCAI